MWPLRIWSHLPKKSLMENFIFCTVQFAARGCQVTVYNIPKIFYDWMAVLNCIIIKVSNSENLDFSQWQNSQDIYWNYFLKACFNQ